VAMLLRDDHRLCVLECGPADAALEAGVRRWQPQVALLGETAEPSMVQRIRSIAPQTGILVLAHAPLREHGMRLLAAGANCVARDAPEIDLRTLVHLTAQGERFFAAADGAWIERRYPPGAAPLTEREQEVLTHLAQGASYAMIAYAMRISYRTVQIYVPRIIKKLGVQDRRELLGLPLPWESTNELTLAACCGC
jgi:two-component system response regulator DesR